MTDERAEYLATGSGDPADRERLHEILRSGVREERLRTPSLGRRDAPASVIPGSEAARR